MPYYCPRCYQVFDDDHPALEQHSREERCDSVPRPASLASRLDGIDNKKQKELKSRKAAWGNSEKEKWVNIWLIVFPEDNAEGVPDPGEHANDFHILADLF
jgi:hypothetical protein